MKPSDFQNGLTVTLMFIIFFLPFATAFYFWFRPYVNFEQKQSQLIFKIKPNLTIIIGTFIVAFSIILFLATVASPQVTKINCVLEKTALAHQDKHTAQCELVEIGWFNNELSNKSVAGINTAKLETIANTDSNDIESKSHYEYQLMLLTDTASIPFRHLNYSDYKLEQLRSIEAKINSFLIKRLENSLSIIEDSSSVGSVGFGFSFFLLLLALVLIGLGTTIDVSLNQEAKTITVSRYQWWGQLATTVIQYPLADLKDVKLQTIEGSEGDTLYRIVFVLNSEEILPLTQIYSSEYQSKRQFVNYIKDFLQSE
ncbi:MAG: hypothetical protein KME55_18150 [Nostoc indistinguendum CM1-VF10]|jgi:hypothetical protein|nr:hypothetical protein [Nostoc indistinguendum CM1-VF10]